MCLTLISPVLAATTPTFVDVPTSSPYATAIEWAVKQGITNGTSPTTFGPNNPCTVNHILTFLFRANGIQGANGTERENVAAWAAGFNVALSGDVCTRSNAVYFMWLAAGSPEPTKTTAFSDVIPNASYAKAVSWAVEQGITNGTGEDTFSPGSPCTRGQVATFLYRSARQADASASSKSPTVQDAPSIAKQLENAIWVGSHPNDAGSNFTEFIKFEGSNYFEVYIVTLSSGSSGLGYAEGTYQLDGDVITMTGTHSYITYDFKTAIVDSPSLVGVAYEYKFQLGTQRGIRCITMNTTVYLENDGEDYDSINDAYEKAKDKILSAASTKPLSDLATNTSTGGKYYAECPGVPDFGATIGILPTSVSPRSNGWTYTYDTSNVTREQTDQYSKLLANEGFVITDAGVNGVGMAFVQVLLARKKLGKARKV